MRQCFFKSTCLGAPMLVQGTVFLPLTCAPMSFQGPPFPPVASAPMLIQGTSGAPVPLLGTSLLPMAWQSGHAISWCYIASPSWPMYMPNFLPRAQVVPPTTLSEGELLALRQELEASLKKKRC